MKRTIRAMLLVAGLTSASAARAGTLYDDLGGGPGIDRLVTSTVDIWLHDNRVAATFDETNMVRLKRMLVAYICNITGGECQYTGQSMQAAHRGLHLATVQFNAVTEDLQTAMDRLDIRSSTQNRLVALLAPLHRDVVSR